MALTLYGVHPVHEALKKRPRSVHRLYITRPGTGKGGAGRQMIALAEQAGIPVIYESAKNIQRIADSGEHQGVAAEVAPFALADLQALIQKTQARPEKALWLVLDSIQDPHNLGSLIRSAVCCGVQAVIFPKDRSARLTGSVAKASAGAVEHVDLCCVVNIASCLEQLKKNSFWVAGTVARSRDSIYKFDYNVDVALVIGGEGKGIRPLVQKKCDFLLSIPMRGPLDSLNASVAGAVILFEAMRQRQKLS